MELLQTILVRGAGVVASVLALIVLFMFGVWLATLRGPRKADEIRFGPQIVGAVPVSLAFSIMFLARWWSNVPGWTDSGALWLSGGMAAVAIILLWLAWIWKVRLGPDHILTGSLIGRRRLIPWKSIRDWRVKPNGSFVFSVDGERPWTFSPLYLEGAYLLAEEIERRGIPHQER